MAEHYYTVRVHGAPTPETAPHGFAWQSETGKWWNSYSYVDGGGMGADAKWFPLPAPPTEQAPPPEPVGRWRVNESPGRTHARILLDNCDVMTCEDAEDAADALNALDRDGVAWGTGRPMSELPDDGLVLVQMSSGVPYTFYIRKADYIATHRNTYECWWPLPGEAQ